MWAAAAAAASQKGRKKTALFTVLKTIPVIPYQHSHQRQATHKKRSNVLSARTGICQEPCTVLTCCRSLFCPPRRRPLSTLRTPTVLSPGFPLALRSSPIVAFHGDTSLFVANNEAGAGAGGGGRERQRNTASRGMDVTLRYDLGSMTARQAATC